MTNKHSTAVLLLAACGGVTTPPPATPTAPAPTVDAAPKPAGTAFGRFTAVGPEGYEVKPLTNGLSFDTQGITIFVVDGAEIGPVKPGKCGSQLKWFATGVVSGLANTVLEITITSTADVPRGCRLAGTTTVGAQPIILEAASFDFGDRGSAFGMVLHQRADDGAAAVFDKVLASITVRSP
jgi:hypothetical protein